MKNFIPIALLLALIVFSASRVNLDGQVVDSVDDVVPVETTVEEPIIVDGDDAGFHVFDDVPAYSIDSFRIVDVTPYEEQLEEARRQQLTWVDEPTQIAMHFAGPAEARTYSLTNAYASAEAPNETKVTVMRDGLLDDSVRGIWNTFHFEREDDRWALKEVYEAYRCARPDSGSDVFQAALCP